MVNPIERSFLFMLSNMSSVDSSSVDYFSANSSSVDYFSANSSSIDSSSAVTNTIAVKNVRFYHPC
jgi:hypothetical protein